MVSPLLRLIRFYPKILHFFIIFSFIFLCAACGQKIANRDSKGTDIICFGDSITQGVGAESATAFPVILSQKLGKPVMNLGRSGDTTADGLKRLQRDVLNKNPRLVIVEFNGNDYLRSVPLEETFKNLDEIVRLIEEKGSMVALAEVRVGFFMDAYFEGFEKIAKERCALLIPNLMKGVFDNPDFKSDHIHPNAQGYALIAERVYQAIKPLLED